MADGFEGSITWVGHGTMLLEAGGTRVLIDAFVDNCPTTPDALKGDGLGDLDAILLTHGHMDHMADAKAHQERTGSLLVAPVEIADWYVSTQGTDPEKVVDLNKGGQTTIGGVRVTMVHAQHSSSLPDGTYAGEPSGFVIRLANGYTIYHSGDTNAFGDMALIRELHAPDLAVLCIGGHYTMGPEEAAKAVELLGVSDVIGMHWGTFPPLKGTPQELQELVGGAARVHVLAPGDTFRG